MEGSNDKTLTAISFDRKKATLKVLDQLLLPNEHVFIPVDGVEKGWSVIRNMNVRGAPAIAIVACLSLSIELLKQGGKLQTNKDNLICFILENLNYLETSRPTAVNLKRSADDLRELVSHHKVQMTSCADMIEAVLNFSENLLKTDVEINLKLSSFGAEKILLASKGKKVKVLTHCNTGSLATGGHGTALGVIRTLHQQGKLEMAYCTETRPYNQGSRLTAYELVYEKIPSIYICDSAASALMSTKGIDAVVVGADRVVSNGDTANKIGTFQLAIVAKYLNVPFYVACPTSTIDLKTKSGADIPIEIRSESEMVFWKETQEGKQSRTPPEGIECWNVAFDVTPADLITGGIITESGVFDPPLNSPATVKALNLQSQV